MLATVMHLMKGTPYIYQGEEIGMTNNRLTRIEDFRDVETLGRYADETAAGITPEDFLAGANANGRDNARTPMQWDASDTAGFTAGNALDQGEPQSRHDQHRSRPGRPGRHLRLLQKN